MVRLAIVAVGVLLTHTIAAAQEVPAQTHYVRGDSGSSPLNPEQPYRPIPASRAKSHESIVEFYRNKLNPRQINWGDKINRRMAVLTEQSVRNPYFRVCAFQTAVILFLLLVCWLWWDKMRQIKWIAAESLADVINAKRLADYKAMEAIWRYNRHIEMCNRVIEGQESGIGAGTAPSDWQREVRDLLTNLETAQARAAKLEAELQQRGEVQKKLEHRPTQAEKLLQERQNSGNAELLARLQRAEAELASRKAVRK